MCVFLEESDGDDDDYNIKVYYDCDSGQFIVVYDDGDEISFFEDYRTLYMFYITKDEHGTRMRGDLKTMFDVCKKEFSFLNPKAKSGATDEATNYLRELYKYDRDLELINAERLLENKPDRTVIATPDDIEKYAALLFDILKLCRDEGADILYPKSEGVEVGFAMGNKDETKPQKFVKIRHDVSKTNYRFFERSQFIFELLENVGCKDVRITSTQDLRDGKDNYGTFLFLSTKAVADKCQGLIDIIRNNTQLNSLLQDSVKAANFLRGMLEIQLKVILFNLSDVRIRNNIVVDENGNPYVIDVSTVDDMLVVTDMDKLSRLKEIQGQHQITNAELVCGMSFQFPDPGVQVLRSSASDIMLRAGLEKVYFSTFAKQFTNFATDDQIALTLRRIFGELKAKQRILQQERPQECDKLAQIGVFLSRMKEVVNILGLNEKLEDLWLPYSELQKKRQAMIKEAKQTTSALKKDVAILSRKAKRLGKITKRLQDGEEKNQFEEITRAALSTQLDRVNEELEVLEREKILFRQSKQLQKTKSRLEAQLNKLNALARGTQTTRTSAENPLGSIEFAIPQAKDVLCAQRREAKSRKAASKARSSDASRALAGAGEEIGAVEQPRLQSSPSASREMGRRGRFARCGALPRCRAISSRHDGGEAREGLPLSVRGQGHGSLC